MEIALQVLITLLAGSVCVPVVFRGKMNSSAEMAFIIGGLMCVAFSILIAVKVNYFSIVACLGATSLLFSKQGRAFLIEVAMMPFEFCAYAYRTTRNLFMEEKVKKDLEAWREVREDLFQKFYAVQNARM